MSESKHLTESLIDALKLAHKHKPYPKRCVWDWVVSCYHEGHILRSDLHDLADVERREVELFVRLYLN